MLPYFFRHYDRWVDRYIFFDDNSDDGTLEILNSHPKVEVRGLPLIKHLSYIQAAQKIHNSCWKESRGSADWVILTPVDELLYHPEFIHYLQENKSMGVTAVPALGFQMLSQAFPFPSEQLTDLVRTGAPWGRMHKLSVFRPDKMLATHYSKGRHKADPRGDIVFPKVDVLLNLHYKYLGFDETLKRHAALNKKLRTYDRKRNFGFRYRWSASELRKDWEYFSERLIDVFDQEQVRQIDWDIKEMWWRSSATELT